jgi:hypothetical protein
LNQIDDEDDNSNYKQEVDQAPANVAEQAKKPEHQQDNNYGPQHKWSFRIEVNLWLVCLSTGFTGLPSLLFGEQRVVLIDKHEHAGDLRIREVLRDQVDGKQPFPVPETQSAFHQHAR